MPYLLSSNIALTGRVAPYEFSSQKGILKNCFFFAANIVDKSPVSHVVHICLTAL